MGKRAKSTFPARRKFSLRRDCRIESAEKKIADVFGLPPGCIRLINPGGRRARSDKHVDGLLRDWGWNE